jgi:PAS domain-containing protein
MHASLESATPTEPLPLHHSWPLFEQGRRFELGYVLGPAPHPSARSAAPPADALSLARRGIGVWECDLSDNALAWSTGVYDIFGLPRDVHMRREETVALYEESSRAVMEHLRAYAIKHQRGFTVDVEIRPDLASPRWMRLIAAPVCHGNRVVRLHGLKKLIHGRA